MAMRAIQSGKTLQHDTISIQRLFQAAFHAPGIVYDRESLCGWRPLRSQPVDRPSLSAPQSTEGIQIRETSERFVIEVELPRIKADSLYIEISGDLLIIRGERELNMNRAEEVLDTLQQQPGPLVHRYIQLPMVARPGEVKARLEGNTVTVNIFKRLNAA